MKIVILSLVAIFIFTSSSSGHPPSDVELKFNPVEKMLTVLASHSVSDSSAHYVDQIIVKVNNEKMIEQKFRSQIDSRVQRAQYIIIDAKPWDEIAVEAGCNISGRIKVKIFVEESVEPPEYSPMEEE